MFHLWKAHPKDLRLRQLCAPQGSIRSCASLHVSFHSWDPYKPYILWHNERDFTNTTSATPNPRTKKIETNFVGLVDARSTKNFNLTLPTIHILQKCPRLGREVTNLGQTFPAWHQHCNSWNMSCSLAIEGFIWFRVTPASSWLQAFATAYMRFAKSYQKLESKTLCSWLPRLGFKVIDLPRRQKWMKWMILRKATGRKSQVTWRHDVTSHLSTSRDSHLVASESSSPITSISVWASPDVFAPMCQAKLQFEPIEPQENTCLKFTVFVSCHLSLFCFC